ncbi:carboxypeptidase-like regulatory domain-containing protein [Runella limosa]|uniref:carboxypeptidase-like regulatory domain-containing protein n=1 Tax=Runella limosa TaxID=370978 RepID=UPI000417EDDA|nr:carboxypeptidase-like regulatory domain-containing protein [Runella limosa]
MKPTTIIIFFGICLTLITQAQQKITQSQQNKYSVVVSDETKRPISSVCVTVIQNGKIIQLETNQNGIFLYPVLNDGKYRVFLEKKAFRADTIELRVGAYTPDTIRLSSTRLFNSRYKNRLLLLDNFKKNIDLEFGGSSCHKPMIFQLNRLKNEIEKFQRFIEKEEKEWKEHEQFILITDDKIKEIESNIKNSSGLSSYKQKIEKAEAKWISNSQIQIRIKKQLDTSCYPINKNWVLRTYLKAFENQQPTYFTDSITEKTEVAFSIQRNREDTTYIFRPVFNKKQSADNFREFTVYLFGNSPIDTLQIVPVQGDFIRNTQKPKDNRQREVSTKTIKRSEKSNKSNGDERFDRRHILGKYVHIVGTQNWTYNELPSYYEIQKVIYNNVKEKGLLSNYKPTIQILIDDVLDKKILVDEETLKSPTQHSFDLPPLNSFLVSFKPDSLNVIQNIEIAILDKNREKKISQTIEVKNNKWVNTPPDSTVGGFLLKIKSKQKK